MKLSFITSCKLMIIYIYITIHRKYLFEHFLRLELIPWSFKSNIGELINIKVLWNLFPKVFALFNIGHDGPTLSICTKKCSLKRLWDHQGPAPNLRCLSGRDRHIVKMRVLCKLASELKRTFVFPIKS
jgi:hypothetical protein